MTITVKQEGRSYYKNENYGRDAGERCGCDAGDESGCESVCDDSEKRREREKHIDKNHDSNLL